MSGKIIFRTLRLEFYIKPMAIPKSHIIGGPKMSGNFVRERQRIVYMYNIHKVGNLISPDEHMTFVKHKIHRSWN